MRSPTRILPPALVVAVALLVAGCGSGESTDTTTPGGTETSEAHQSGAEGPTGIRAQICRRPGEEAVLLRVTGVPCAMGRKLVSGWQANSDCAPAPGNSRAACTVSGFRCLSTAAGQGLAVTCARPERAVAFLARSG